MKLRERLAETTAGKAAFPLLLLFALNLVDEFDQVVFGVLAPEIRDSFAISDTLFTTIVTLAGALVILLIVPVSYLADRHNRVRMATIAAVAWSSMSVLTGLAPVLWVLVLARFGAGLGRVMNEPVHASLLADYYPPEAHGRIYALHRMGNPLGLLLVLVGGLLGQLFGWRMTFVLLAIPTVVVIGFLSRLKEPLRGETVDAELALEAERAGERVPLGEAFRSLAAIRSLKRTWVAAFFLGAAVIPITTFFSFFYEQVYDVLNPGPWGRAGIIAIYAGGAVVGLLLGFRLSHAAITAGRLPRLATLAGGTLVATGGALLAMSVAPVLWLSIVFTFLVGVAGAGFQAYNLPLVASIAPPRLRSQAFGWFGFWFAVGAILLAAFVAGVGEDYGYRWGIGTLAVLVILSGFIYASGARYVDRDAEQAAKTLAVAAALRAQLTKTGSSSLLTCKEVEVSYDGVQVLFGVDIEVRQGEIVALLGTNGAGKSTLLNAISGIVDPNGGAIFFDGRDITHADGAQTARAGIAQVPGGKAVFPTLSVSEHLRAAAWLYRDDEDHVERAVEEVLETFPRLRERYQQAAGNLSGGEQQMLGLGMAFIAKPKLLIIDELSLGLAPTIVEDLLQIVRRIHAQGTAIVLVEQSVNVALSVADRAYFLEKGEVRFEGPTAELLERGDIVRSVFLSGALAPPADGTGGDTVELPAVRVAGEPRAGDAGFVDLSARAVLSCRAMGKRFGGIRAVDGVDLVLHEREILGLIGPNGAGKTTIMDLISGYLRPDEGRIALGEADVTDASAHARARLGLGRSFQDARLVSSLTVAENLAIALDRHLVHRDHIASALGLPMVRQQEEDVAWTVEDLIELVNLGAFRDKFVRELSTGSRRIVDLAMLIAHDPKVLLLDEPSSGIAQRETEALGPLLQRIRRETGCAMVVIEHDMPLIRSVSDRLVALDLGRVITVGSPDAVLSDPVVVTSYLGGDPAAVQRSGQVGEPTTAGAGSSP
jgi:ABC-type branched-subunit amino acid transport system ATPase component/predicted MFS family arabinose efflux permease